ncbi:hypothetical protein [Sphingomonas baiyangensis]|uniref:Glycerophosphoryl diester phosphodiesterase membrane domain-containing protein n=1 Tax=Sphingomonas baiyangensis TaxID=2572576 RepID=A0A4U1L4U7_9SPHN|nr:hypothetical protein [Sphingomonas baiyangensis]TKD51270.1 hypothetical protein FBR43_11275 [Sphingomonas baiyangensis]
MTLAPATLLAEAGALWRAERPLLAPLAGLFLMLPALAMLLLLPQPDPVAADGSAMTTEALVAYALANAPAILAANLMQLYGATVILALFLGSPRPTLAQALRGALALLPLVVIASIAVWAMVFVGAIVIVPALYLIGRCFLVTPAIVAEGPIGPVAAISRSFALTRRRGWLFFAIAAMIFVVGQAVVVLAGGMEQAVAEAGIGSPVSTIGFNLVAAMATAAASVATLLVKVVVYRRLSSGI